MRAAGRTAEEKARVRVAPVAQLARGEALRAGEAAHEVWGGKVAAEVPTEVVVAVEQAGKAVMVVGVARVAAEEEDWAVRAAVEVVVRAAGVAGAAGVAHACAAHECAAREDDDCEECVSAACESAACDCAGSEDGGCEGCESAACDCAGSEDGGCEGCESEACESAACESAVCDCAASAHAQPQPPARTTK